MEPSRSSSPLMTPPEPSDEDNSGEGVSVTQASGSMNAPHAFPFPLPRFPQSSLSHSLGTTRVFDLCSQEMGPPIEPGILLDEDIFYEEDVFLPVSSVDAETSTFDYQTAFIQHAQCLCDEVLSLVTSPAGVAEGLEEIFSCLLSLLSQLTQALLLLMSFNPFESDEVMIERHHLIQAYIQELAHHPLMLSLSEDMSLLRRTVMHKITKAFSYLQSIERIHFLPNDVPS